MNNKPWLCMATVKELEQFAKKMEIPSYRAGQVENWLSKRLTSDLEKMKNIPKDLKEKLAENFRCHEVITEKVFTAPDGLRKLLLRLSDGETIECAIIPAEDKRFTFCLSTQVGCPVHCAFCASGASGFVRNLADGEIVEQFFAACEELGRLPDNVVIMGIGEPLLNCDNLISALERICDPERIALAARRVTISTSGWTPGIKQLAKHGRQWNLAVSLHAPDDKTRSLLIPTRFRRDIREILQACALHRAATTRMLTFEYVMLENINDSVEQAAKLGELAKEAHAKVNLIPYNKANGAFTRPAPDVIKRFENRLKTVGVQVTVRVEKGSETTGACGQLRASAMKKQQEKPS